MCTFGKMLNPTGGGETPSCYGGDAQPVAADEITADVHGDLWRTHLCALERSTDWMLMWEAETQHWQRRDENSESGFLCSSSSMSGYITLHHITFKLSLG